MKQFAMIVGALLVLSVLSCEKNSGKSNGFDWDLQPSDVDQPGNTDDGATGDNSFSDTDSDELIDALTDDLLDEEPQSDGDQPATDQEHDGDSATDTPVGDTDNPVTDNTGTNDELLINDSDEVLTTNHRPVADAGPDLTALIGYDVTIDASKSYDFDQDDLNFHWSIVSQPEGSDIQIDLTDPQKPIFSPGLKGVYVFRLTVNDGKEYGQPDEVSINVADYEPINFEIVDSAYSKSLDSIVFVSKEPKNMLYIFDIEAKTISNIALPLIPKALSISPDGNEAVVGHDGWFSHVDLANKELLDTYPAQTVVFDIVFGAGNRVYVFPDISYELIVFNADTGEEISRLGDENNKWTRSHAVRLPAADRLIAVKEGGSYISLLDISVLPPEEVSLIESVFPIGDELWIAENGTKIFTQSGSIFLADDLQYMGRLEELETVKHLHNLGTEGRTVAIPGGADDIQLNLYTDPYLSYEKTIKLPAISINDIIYQYHGEVVYFNKDDTKIVTVITTQIGAIDNYALAIIENF